MAGTRASIASLMHLDSKTAGNPDIDADLRLLQQLYQRFKAFTCREPNCRAPLVITRASEHVKGWMPNAKGSQPVHLSAILCKKCKKHTCVGCRKKPMLGSKGITIRTTPEVIIQNCCEGGNTFAIWALLSMFDEAELFAEQQSIQHVPKNSGHSVASKGSGYATDAVRRRSRYGAGRFDKPYRQSASLQPPKEKDGKLDKIMCDILQLLGPFLPLPGTKSAPELCAMLRLSRLLDCLSALVRNDSVTDMSKRKDLYHAAFTFLTTIAKQPSLVTILLERRRIIRESPGLQALGGAAKGHKLKIDKSSAGLAPSLMVCGKQAHKHAKAFAGLTSNAVIMQDLYSGGNNQTVALCRELLLFYQTAKVTAPSAMKAIAPPSKDAWTTFAEENKVTYTDDVLKYHKFQDKFSISRKSPLGRMSHLWKELTMLSTSLPSGIFLKVSDARPDVMKFLIVGVDGTSYTGGLFIFDLFLPPDWPQSPPLILFAMEQSGYMARGNIALVNPNIYSNGTVCLSLLDTFEGSPQERWQPNKSTLLSVLVSIHAMILGVSDPIENIPKLYRREIGGTTSKLKYLKHVQCETVLIGMLSWLENDDAKRSVWRDIVAKYWRHKGSVILDNVKQWSRINEYLQAYDPGSLRTFHRRRFPGNTWDGHNHVGQKGDLIARLEKGLISARKRLTNQGTSQYGH